RHTRFSRDWSSDVCSSDLIILDKPLELGSTQAVGAVKRNLREAGLLGKGNDKTKVGHGGTLDPLATGVLPIAIGEATKLCGRMQIGRASCRDRGWRAGGGG